MPYNMHSINAILLMHFIHKPSSSTSTTPDTGNTPHNWLPLKVKQSVIEALNTKFYFPVLQPREQIMRKFFFLFTIPYERDRFHGVWLFQECQKKQKKFFQVVDRLSGAHSRFVSSYSSHLFSHTFCRWNRDKIEEVRGGESRKKRSTRCEKS